ncbi:MAG TPA: Beta-galactosidase C-terminal domain [Candidatus Lachnoclostridium pullistercoris]|uniref:Beta-galactosidase C-terminal domain n=1 Tax=Candidatus Lachnoclostridium pullistercoris TaxID=2838632 RepID=A0A9D2T6F3_9FIRM|nr:Beta-galactosidase C-terminal domain [Candidatus Lachnoclostridium pullistercoris]
MERETVFKRRLSRHYDELKWLYCELYEGGIGMFEELVKTMEKRSRERDRKLKRLDKKREEDPDWYKRNDMVGMMMYTDAFAGTLKGVKEKLDYIEECGVRCLHLMPLLDSPAVNNDGGYAVSDFTKVKESLGTMEDLKDLAEECHRRTISVCLDFVMNHTSEEHEWARRARAGEKEYQDRYFFFDSYEIPAQYERTCPQVFPTTAPGNFTWLEDAKKYVMTTFYPYQWDLNYRNPVVFNTMVDYLLNLANHGIDVIRVDAVPYIWKELGTSCRNLPQVHTLVRMIRMICETVCPAVLLLGEVVMEPAKVVPYFGTVEKPECHMLYNVTTMASIWHTVATGKVSLLKHQMDVINGLPREYVFLNYLRCHDDIGWGLEYAWLRREHMEEVPHKRFLSDYFTGKWPGSMARGELYNDDPSSGDARLCGTTASLCGLEGALEAGDKDAEEKALSCDLMLHAFMMTLSGIPMLYSGDEIGQLNDYSYKNDPGKAADSRYVHRGKFHWDAAEKRKTAGTVQQRLFSGIGRLEKLRKSLPVFLNAASVRTSDTCDPAVLCLVRELDGEKLVALFNFSGEEKTARISEPGMYKDLLSEESLGGENVPMGPYGARWMLSEQRI